jgi:uncharacterized protein YvpB
VIREDFVIKKLFLALMTSVAFASILIIQSAPVKAFKTYVLHFQYTSQLYPLYAQNACEAASLKMVLSAKKSVWHPSIKTIICRMPRSKNPNQGFTGNP